MQDHECQFWCPTPLREGEQHRWKLRSDKYQPPAALLLEYYESDSSVEADEDTDTKVGGDAETGPEVGSAAKPKRKTRAAASKQSATTATTKATALK
jgi:hypothetical protein